MDTIKVKDGKIYESQDVEINLPQLEIELEERQKSIDEQIANVNALKEKIEYIKSLHQSKHRQFQPLGLVLPLHIKQYPLQILSLQCKFYLLVL